jgi:Fe-S cluster assembly iron-binding protein IscA
MCNTPTAQRGILMLTVTEAACGHLAGLLYNANASDEAAIRFVFEGNRITPTLDQERPDDTTYEYAGSTVLVLDEHVVALLNNRTLDVQDADDGPQLVLRQS